MAVDRFAKISISAWIVLIFAGPIAVSAESPDAQLYARISAIRHSDSELALDLAKEASLASKPLTPEKWRLRMIYADLLIDQAGNSKKNLLDEARSLMNSPVPSGVPDGEKQARLASLNGFIRQQDSRWKAAAEFYDKAHAGLAFTKADPCWRAELLIHHQAQTVRHLEDWTAVANLLKQASESADACPDPYWLGTMLIVEGNAYNDRGSFENALQSFQKCLAVVRPKKVDQLLPVSLQNLALAYENLGDYDNAINYFDKADAYYKNLGALKVNKKAWGRAKGQRARAYLELKRYDDAVRVYNEAIDFAKATGDPDYLNRWRDELTSVYIEKRDYGTAANLNRQVLADTALTKDFPVAVNARLNAARLARLKGDFAQARTELETLRRDLDAHGEPTEDAGFYWRAHTELAQTFVGLNQIPEARHEFEEALNTAESARKSIRATEYRLTYFRPLRAIYQAYVDFLVAHDRPERALAVAESGHARILVEKLRSKRTPTATSDFTRVAAAKNAVILSYSIGPERSYMWATSAQGVKLFPLPPEDELRRLVERHNEPILDERSLSEDLEGRKLFDLVVGPAAEWISSRRNVIVIPDGPLADLNFETLIPPGPNPRYWLETAAVTVAPSLNLILPEPRRAINPNSVLAVGNAIQADPLLKPLGGEELRDLKGIYSSRFVALEQSRATPKDFEKANPAQYSLIHFSAHAIANRESPLDSYVVLSPQNDKEFRLYARDLGKFNLKADLVTLSACQSARARNVPGEGLVGLAWAVLGAGARNVVASLWPVPAPATAKLMKRFYVRLNAGETPDRALRHAKVDILTPGSPTIEWAAFQLYSR